MLNSSWAAQCRSKGSGACCCQLIHCCIILAVGTPYYAFKAGCVVLNTRHEDDTAVEQLAAGATAFAAVLCRSSHSIVACVAKLLLCIMTAASTTSSCSAAADVIRLASLPHTLRWLLDACGKLARLIISGTTAQDEAVK